MKRVSLAMLAVFVAWQVLDFITHGMILKSAYEETAQLWRPIAEMKMGTIYLASIIYAACFVGIYGLFIRPKSAATGFKYGLLFGIGTGIFMGYGTYSVMPITYYMALTCFFGVLLKMVAAGLIVGALVKEPEA